jgi:peptidoglycan/xylan/chitin deacetylase (PgdA/CDA1 family)
LLALYDHTCKTVSKIDTQEKKLAITFVTANGAGRTENLLALLEKYGARCTFFLGGDYATRLPHLAASITAAGHETASHSLYHIDMRDAEDERIYAHISMSMELIGEAAGQPVTLFRPPYGFSTYRDQAIAHALGCESIFWTFDSMDGFADQMDIQILKRMLDKSEPGAIILMHVYGQYTLAVLEQYLPRMREQGYEFVTVSELMQCGGR